MFLDPFFAQSNHSLLTQPPFSKSQAPQAVLSPNIQVTDIFLLIIILSKMFIYKGSTRTRFQILLKFKSFIFILENYICHEFNRMTIFCGGNISIIMPL